MIISCEGGEPGVGVDCGRVGVLDEVGEGVSGAREVVLDKMGIVSVGGVVLVEVGIVSVGGVVLVGVE